MRLIDADAMLTRLENWNTSDLTDKALYNFTLHRILEQPTIQPERKKGRWVEVTDGMSIWTVCDQCGEKPLWNEWKTDRCESNFCPNCGSYNGGEEDGQI